MSLTNLSVAGVRSRTPSHRRAFKQLLVASWQRLRSRYELASLSEDSLRDIGLSRGEAEFEASKPFWR